MTKFMYIQVYRRQDSLLTTASCSRSSSRVAVVVRSQLYFFFMFSCIFFILSWASFTSAKNCKERTSWWRENWLFALWISMGGWISQINVHQYHCFVPGSRLCFLWDEPQCSSTVGGSSSTESAGQLWRPARDGRHDGSGLVVGFTH